MSPWSANPALGEQPALRVHVDHRAGRIAVVGRLGRRTAHLVHDAIPLVLQSDRIWWLIDVTGLTADQTGLRVLGSAYRRLLRGGRQMILLGASPQLRQALRRLRLAEQCSTATATRRPEPPSGCLSATGASTATRWALCHPFPSPPRGH